MKIYFVVILAYRLPTHPTIYFFPPCHRNPPFICCSKWRSRHALKVKNISRPWSRFWGKGKTVSDAIMTYTPVWRWSTLWDVGTRGFLVEGKGCSGGWSSGPTSTARTARRHTNTRLTHWPVTSQSADLKLALASVSLYFLSFISKQLNCTLVTGKRGNWWMMCSQTLLAL